MTESTVSEVVERLEAALTVVRNYAISDQAMLRIGHTDLPLSVEDLRDLLSTIKAGKEDQDERPESPSASAGTHIPRSPIDWRTINTCPKDGSVFFAYGVYDGVERFEVVFYDYAPPDNDLHQHDPAKASLRRKDWCFGTQDGPWLHRDLFTHWAPLFELRPGAARDMGLSRAPQGADDASGSAPKPVSQGDHAPGEGSPRCAVCGSSFPHVHTTQTEGGAA